MSRPTLRSRVNLEAVAGVLLGCVIGVLGAAALMHWMASCWEAGPGAMCTLLATQSPRWPALGRLVARVRAACLRKELQWEESALDHMQAAEAALPREITHQQRRIDQLRVAAMLAEAQARGEA